MRRTACIAVATLLALAGCRGEHEGAGTRLQRPRAEGGPVRACHRTDGGARPAPPAKQILFGDLHVHTTFSADAFLRSLPMLQGEGAHPPADACDFARYCSALDFWSINDHAEAITPQHWQETKESIRAVQRARRRPAEPRPRRLPRLGVDAGRPHARDPLRPQERDLARHRRRRACRARPISALDAAWSAPLRQRPPLWQRLQLPARSTGRTASATSTSASSTNELAATPLCPDGVDTRELPARLPRDGAARRTSLFEKLDAVGLRHARDPARHHLGLLHAAGLDAGTSSSTRAQHDPERQTLIEVYSGHGNSEEYRSFEDGRRSTPTATPVCPAPTPDLPALLLAGRRDHPRALRRRAARRSASGASRTRARNYLERRRAPAAPRVPAPRRRGLARLRPVPRLLPARLQLPAAAARRSTRSRISNFDDPARAAPLPLRLHRVERQPQRAARHRLQGVRPPPR